ncbi:MAG: lantibiotic dehydratase [Arcicella sp.]|nr:lantibiotic dehydratase [Arcicella sp.]
MFHPKLIVRTPSLPFSDDISEDFLKQYLDNPAFSEAVYLASPVLFKEAILWKKNKITDPKKLQKIPLSLAKYYTRMCSRCTPFGLFAGCGVVEWSDETNLIISENTERNTRLDMHYAGALAQRLAEIPAVKISLKYYPNSSVYQIGEDIRYVEYKYVDGQRKHQISAITWSEYIQMVLDLCKTGAKITDLLPHLIDDEISEEEAVAFIEELIDTQLLVNELEPAITGDEFTQQVQKTLAPQGNLGEILQKIQLLLAKIDQNKVNDTAAYQEVIETLNAFEVPFEEGKLFQTDLVKLFSQNSLDKKYQEVLSEIYNLSKNLTEKPINQKLKDFKTRYFERYETKEIPILFALDTETGIGYGDSGKSNNTPIADGLNMPVEENLTVKFQQNPFQQYLFKLWLEAYKNDSYQVDLQENDLTKFIKENNKTAPSSSIMFRLTGDENLPIYLEGISGSSAANLLGRFAHADKNVLEIVKKITDDEQANNPDVIFAEIVHLPENRIGNILLHPPFRVYEIPYLAKSSLDAEHQIHLEELMVSVDLQQDRVILRSKRLNKEIIPRLSNAHNYSQNSLPLYNFLCDIQNQNIQRNFNVGWKNIAYNTTFSPRLTYKNVILELASWSFKKEDFKEIISNNSDYLIELFAQFKAKWKLPKLFVLADFDNELLVNSDNKLSLKTFLDAIKNRDRIELKEFFFDEKNSLVKNTLGKGFTNQFIASWINEDDKILSKINHVESQIQRNFSFGTEWVYFKFYTGAKGGDLVLNQAIKPLISDLFDENLIDNWFFIRYADPEKHIRFRVRLRQLSDLGKVSEMIKKSIQAFENEEIIWKIQADTYQREIERYGADMIELTEIIFCEDSMAVLEMLDKTWGDEREPIRWQWCMKLIDAYLDDFGYNLVQKRNLLEMMKTSFAREFRVDKNLKMQIDQRFRDNRQTIERILDNSLNDSHEYAPLFEAILFKSKALAEIIPKIKDLKPENDWNKYLSNTIHMSVNRTISDNQRTHELVIYDFLYRYYQAELAKSKKK